MRNTSIVQFHKAAKYVMIMAWHDLSERNATAAVGVRNTQFHKSWPKRQMSQHSRSPRRRNRYQEIVFPSPNPNFAGTRVLPRRKESIMMLATLVNQTSVPAPPDPFSLIIRKALVAVGLAGALAAGAVAFPGTASAQEPPSHNSLVVSTSQLFPCPFGTHGGKKGGCRGGSAVKDIREHGYEYTTIVGCAGAAVATKNPGVGIGCGILLQSDPAY